VKLSELNAEIGAALALHGFEAVRGVLLSPLGEKKGRRCAYRIEDEGGKVVKVRLFENAEEARRVFEQRAALEEAFAPAVACHGAVLIEAWVEGVPLVDLDWESWVEPAGALLGRLHATPLGAHEPPNVSTRRWREGAESDLEILTAAGTIASAEADRLRAELRQRDPGESRTALIHTDFCADNMVIDTRGRLRVIDNEGMAVRPPGFDLARTFQLWPMSKEARVRFRRGYLSSAPMEPEAPGFWRIAAVLLGARIFLKLSATRLEASVGLLREFLAGKHLSGESQ
jgi:aminoglycoside phosphotransferase (APT) family kinase protein